MKSDTAVVHRVNFQAHRTADVKSAPMHNSWASPMSQMVKILPAIQETRVLPLGGEGLLKKGMATHPSILAWEIPGREEPGGLQSMGLQRVGHD